MGKKITCFTLVGLVFLSYFNLTQALELISEKASKSQNINDYKEYFLETFDNKTLKNNKIRDSRNTIWKINKVEGQENSITDNGALELGGAQYMQRAVLDEKLWDNKQDYAMEFTINVQSMGNVGHSGRPIAIIIPRTKDKSFNKYYAVTYHMENTYMGAIIANMYKCKWAIINTAAPTKTEALVEGYYLLRENVDYTGRLVIHNTDEGNVNIKFYIDGPTNPSEEYKPLLEYTDSSSYKIISSEAGPAFGMAGYSDDGWGYSPIVRYDNIKLYELDEYRKYEKQLKEYSKIRPKDIKLHEKYGEIQYLINRGIFSAYSDGTFKPDRNIAKMEFLKMLIRLKGERYLNDKDYIERGIKLGIIDKKDIVFLNSPINKYDAALMITRYFGNPSADRTYISNIKDRRDIKDKELLNSVLFTYYEGYIRLNDDFKFMGEEFINRSKGVSILMRMIDDGYRKVNYSLELPHVLSSGAVLQRNKKIPIWGRGVSGETIKVKFRKQVKTAVVKNGHWYLELEPESHGGPYTLTVSSKKDKITLKDIYVGEVFIVAGQSNAEMYLNECNDAEETKKKLMNKEHIRFYETQQIMAVRPSFTTIGKWEASYEWAIDWSAAVGTFFIEKLIELNDDLEDVPLGVIPITYGGSTIELFMPNTITEEKNFVQKDNEPIMSGFWNGFMESVAPYGAKGVIYYQGENSTQLGYKYEPLLRDYLRGFRKEFKDINLPFMLVQISGYGDNSYENDVDTWPIIREVQMKVANTTDNTGLVTSIDLADPDPMEIHPKEKKPIGVRLAYLAMDMIYGKDLGYKSAEIKSYKFADNKVIVDFDYTFGSLYIKDNTAKGFQILDSNGKWHRAKARVNEINNTVEIWCDSIPVPQGARYAWNNYPSNSLYNNVDLPTLPFRIVNAPDSTTSNILKITNHMLNNHDAIVNLTRDNYFRVVNRLDSNTLSHEYAIKDQASGDTIVKLLRLENARAQDGTTETSIKIYNHGLSVGDWIRNNTRRWEARRVDEVLDKDTIVVRKITDQGSGDDISRYQFNGETIAE